MPKKIDLTSQRFGRLIVIKELKERRNKQIYWLCKCDCGNECEIIGNSLKQGHTKSCGCLQIELTAQRFRKYDSSTETLRHVLSSIKQRCLNPKNSDYYLYGGRGITICKEWLDSVNGVALFVHWSLENGYKKGLSIDRIDNSKGYSPDNCRWVDNHIQGRNKRTNHLITFNEETHCLAEWAEIKGIKYHTLKQRINKYKWSIEDALTIPTGGQHEHINN